MPNKRVESDSLRRRSRAALAGKMRRSATTLVGASGEHIIPAEKPDYCAPKGNVDCRHYDFLGDREPRFENIHASSDGRISFIMHSKPARVYAWSLRALKKVPLGGAPKEVPLESSQRARTSLFQQPVRFPKIASNWCQFVEYFSYKLFPIAFESSNKALRGSRVGIVFCAPSNNVEEHR